MEIEVDYFHRRAFEEREGSEVGRQVADKRAHTSMAEDLKSLVRESEAERRRLTLYDVMRLALRSAGADDRGRPSART